MWAHCGMEKTRIYITNTSTSLLTCFWGSCTSIIGLRYEDLLIDQDNEVAEALKLADPGVVQGRSRRVLRAFDLDLKKKNFVDYAPDVDQETFKVEIYDDILNIREREAEFVLLNLHKK